LKKFHLALLGGTFDIIHKGHRALIAKAFEVSEKLIIGLTVDDFVKNKGIWNNYETRLRNLEKFLKENFPYGKYEIVPLKDYFGPKAFDEDVEAIVVSEETKERAKYLNKLRREKGLRPLKIVVVKMVKAEDGLRISSSRIRRGEIDEEGRRLIKL